MADRVERRAIAAGLLLAAAVGAAYAFSPLSVIFAAAMGLLVRRTVRGISGDERRWVVSVLVLGIAVRVLALVVLYASTDPWREQFRALYGDGRFSVQRSLWILNAWQGVPIGPWYRLGTFTAYGGVSFDRFLALVQWLFGPSPYGLTLINVAAFVGGTALMYRVARPSFGPTASLFGMIVILFWPTFFVWSISMLKESLQFFLCAAGISAAVWAARTPRWQARALLALIVLASAFLIAPLRGGSRLSLLGGVAFGYAAFVAARRSAGFVAALSCALAVIAVAGSRPAIQARIVAGVDQALRYHVGHVKTPGKAYRAADQRFYSEGRRESSPASADEAGRFLVRSAAMFVLVPLPSQITSASELAFLPQQIAWYILVALSLVGAWMGFRRDALLTGMCVGYCLAAAVIIAPFSGNIGTLVRHRDMVLPFVVWLSGLGAVSVLGAMSRKRHASY